MNQPSVQQLAQLLEESMQAGQFPMLTVTSNSMAPLLQIGDQVQLESVTWEQLQPGDIITVVTEQDFLTHRFWGIRPYGPNHLLLTRGDRVLAYDPPLPTERLLGRVCGRQRLHKTVDFRMGNGRRRQQHLAQLAALTNRLLVPATPPPNTAQRTGHRLLYLWARLFSQ